MAKQPTVLNSECSGGDQIQPTHRHTPHKFFRRGAPTSLANPFEVHRSDEGASSSTSTPWGSPYSPSSFANRSPHCMLVRRSSLVSKTSSGYFSFEVSPAPVYCDKATQTPSPPCQAFNHYLSEMAAARNPNDLVDMRPEIWIARELRRIGDEYNDLYNPRRALETSGMQVLERGHRHFTRQANADTCCPVSLKWRRTVSRIADVLLDNRRRAVANDQVIILRVLHYIIRLIWRLQWL